MYPSSFWGGSSTRSSLIRRLSNLDDHEAWTDFVARYAEPIHRIARAKGLSRHDAEDLVQQVLVRVARAMPVYRRCPRPGAFRRWLGTLARWCAGDHWRQIQREQVRIARSAEALRVDQGSVIGSPAWAVGWVDAGADSGPVDMELCQLALRRLQSRFSDRDLQIFDQLVLQGKDGAFVAWFHATSRTAVYLVKFRMLGPFRREVETLREGYTTARVESWRRHHHS